MIMAWVDPAMCDMLLCMWQSICVYNVLRPCSKTKSYRNATKYGYHSAEQIASPGTTALSNCQLLLCIET